MKSKLALLLIACSLPLTTPAATVTGSLSDISIQALNTKLLFAPTNEVLVTPNGLSAGPPKLIQTSGGQFSISLEAGDYTRDGRYHRAAYSRSDGGDREFHGCRERGLRTIGD